MFPNVKSGYRKVTPSCLFCACSCGCGHNEICNVWTHVFASLYYYNSFKQHNPSWPSRWVALGGACLFGTSATAHCTSCYSKTVEDIMFRLDRASISAYFTCFSIVAGYQHFGSRGEHDLLRKFVMSTFVLGSASTLSVLFGPALPRLGKVITLGSVTGCIFVPVLREYLYSRGVIGRMKTALVFQHLPVCSFFAVVGALAFITSVPERIPNIAKKLGLPEHTFDYFSSHSIMHILVFIAAYWGYIGQTKWDAILSEEAKLIRTKTAAKSMSSTISGLRSFANMFKRLM